MTHNLINCPKCTTPFYAQGLRSHLRANKCTARVAVPAPVATAPALDGDQERRVRNLVGTGRLTRDQAIKALGY